MDAYTLQDRIAKGMGTAARKLGLNFTLYRPRGAFSPCAPCNRMIELSAAFRAQGGGAPRAPEYGDALWEGIFDTSYTRAGDYLLGERSTYFVATQYPGLPVQCVLTNRVVTVARPLPAAPSGYSGFHASGGEVILQAWPAAVISAGLRATDARLSETRLGAWILLLPPQPIAVSPGDVVTDDRGDDFAVSSAEQSALGWRLLLRELAA